MDAFPPDYVVHNLPLIVLSGLGPVPKNDGDGAESSRVLLHEGSFRIKIDVPPVNSKLAQDLLRAFLNSDSGDAPWNSGSSTAKDRAGSFKIRSIGRAYTLPPRKAPPPPHSPRLRPSEDGDSPPQPLVLHSTLSPLTPSSPLYPDGLVTPLWITKHQARLPSAFFAFFSMTSDANTSSLLDNKLKSEISNIRNVFNSTSYKTKVVVVLVGENVITPSELEERLTLIRRSASLDSKGLYFLPSGSSPVETVEFVRHILSTIQPLCIEYYRDLSKHARRKRGRSALPPPTVPPTVGSSQTLSLQGWNVRYEFKLGVLAEFRQEMDAACRNYEAAYESLLAPEIFEPIATSSPRFNEARMLADVIAIRIIRCQLWTGQSTGAVRSWVNHHDRVKDLLIRQGIGTDNYAWEAWQSIWSKTMADIISRASFAALFKADPETQTHVAVFTGPEKTLPMGERLSPWEHLHHEGFWLTKAERHIHNRRRLAMKISEGERAPPGSLPASAVSMKIRPQSSYLALEPHAEFPIRNSPGYDYTRDIVETLKRAIEQFSIRRQLRAMEYAKLNQAVELIISEAWQEAIAILRPLWMNSLWRQAGWWKLLQEIGWALMECASHVQDLETIIRLEWELASRIFTPRPNHKYDLHSSLQDYVAVDPRPAVMIVGDEQVSTFFPSFAFALPEGHVGEKMEAQLCIRSRLQSGAAPIVVSELKIVFDGSLRPVHLVHSAGSDPNVLSSTTQLLHVDLRDSSTISNERNKRASAGAIASLIGYTNLSFGPDEIKIFRLVITPREAGDVTIASITLIIDDELFSLTSIASRLDQCPAEWWEMRAGVPILRRIGMERDATTIEILPKPPKMAILAPDLKKVYYTNEQVEVRIDVHNHEEDTALASVDARLISPLSHAATIKWLEDYAEDSRKDNETGENWISLPTRDIGSLAASADSSVTLLVSDTIDALDHEIEIAIGYHLVSDPIIPLAKRLTLELPIIRPFEANYEFVARLEAEPWPNFFEGLEQSASTAPSGLKQLFMVTASVYSFASDVLIIEGMTLKVQEVTGEATCQTSTGHRRQDKVSPTGKDDDTDLSKSIKPDETQKFAFDLRIQKMVLGDRHTASADLALDIRWRRSESRIVNTSTLELPRFAAPMSEPRVLLTVFGPAAGSHIPGLCHLKFTIENPSMHFLTFNISMDSSEDFAFSGPKSAGVSLVPVSRHAVEYRILANRRGEWVRVNLAVVDAYFGKTLKVQGAGEGVRVDKKGGVFIWVEL